MNSEEYIAQLRALDPDGTTRVVLRVFDAPGSDGEFVDDPGEPEVAWIKVERGHAINHRSGAAVEWAHEKWCREGDDGAIRVIIL